MRRTRLLPLAAALLSSSAALAQTLPPANVQMANGTSRATTPAITYCRDGTDIVICPIGTGGGGGGGTVPTGTAGSPNSNVLTVQGITGGVAQPVNGTVTANLGTLNGAATDTTVNGLFKSGQSIGNTAFGISGQLPAFAATPTFNFGTIGAAATETSNTLIGTRIGDTASPAAGTVNARLGGINTTLGSPFQAGGSIANTFFGARLQDATGAAFGTLGNPIYVSGGAGGGGSTPTGTAGSPNAAVVTIQGISGGTVVPVSGTFYQTTQPVSAASLPLPTGAATETTLAGASAKLPASLGAKTGANSLSVTPASDATFAVTGAFFQSTQPVSNAGAFAVQNTAATPAGTNVIGSVGNQAAVTTAAPTYTTGTQANLSLTTAGALRTDASATTQPVSGSVAVSNFPASQTVTQATAANLNATVVGTGTLAVQNTAAIPAGTNTIGSIANITGTVSLPTGAATAANQAAVATAGSAAPTTGTAAMTYDGTNARRLLSDSRGALTGSQAAVATTRTTLTANTATALETAGVAGRVGAGFFAEAALTANVYICTTQTTGCSATTYDFLLPSGAGAGTIYTPIYPSNTRYYAFSTAAPVLVLNSWTAQ